MKLYNVEDSELSDDDKEDYETLEPVVKSNERISKFSTFVI